MNVTIIDPRYFRPTEVETLLGDPSKAKQKLGWASAYAKPCSTTLKLNLPLKKDLVGSWQPSLKTGHSQSRSQSRSQSPLLHSKPASWRCSSAAP